MRRLRCDGSVAELAGDYAPYAEGVCPTCWRCGHETSSYGTSEASIRRCLALLREECPNSEHNYYMNVGMASDPTYEQGYRDGLDAGRRQVIAHDPGCLNADQLHALVTLCHPDRHPPERFDLANAATAKLLDLLRREREAA